MNAGEALADYFKDAGHCCDPDEVASEVIAALFDAGYEIVPIQGLQK